MTSAQAEADRVVGVDAGRIGKGATWSMATTGPRKGSSIEFHIYPSFRKLWRGATATGLLTMAVDMPLGLPRATDDWRPCEIAARELLGEERRETVFPSPPLCTLNAPVRKEADRVSVDAGGRKLTNNQFRLLPKCRDVREVLEPGMFDEGVQPRVVEVHAEVCFRELNGEQPTRFEKRHWSGQVERLKLLRSEFSNIDEAVMEARQRCGTELDLYDLADAAAAAWTARRVAAGTADPLGGGVDEDGYPMLIWA